jgi:ribonuclease HI
MSRLLLFTDASVDSRLHTGFGAYLAIAEPELDAMAGMSDVARLRAELKIQQFATRSSTQLEIQNVLWALQELMARQPATANRIILYTDSQAIIDLPRRRKGLEQSGFTSAAGKPLNHAVLYQAFYKLHDSLGFELAKLKGHSPRADKTQLDRVFAVIDKAVRQALREYRQQIAGTNATKVFPSP